MAQADDGEVLAVGLEVLPGAGRRSADHVLEAEAAGVPRLVGEGALLVLRVEGADGRELDLAVADQHRYVLPQLRLRNGPDREDADPNHAPAFHAHVRLHCRTARAVTGRPFGRYVFERTEETDGGRRREERESEEGCMDPGSVGPSHHGSSRQMLPLLVFQRERLATAQTLFFQFHADITSCSLVALPSQQSNEFFFFSLKICGSKGQTEYLVEPS